MLTVKITQQDIDYNTETSFNCTKAIYDKDTELAKSHNFPLNKSFSGFADLILNKFVLKSANIIRACVNTGTLTLETNEIIQIVDVYKNSSSNFFFDIFNKLGIPISMLRIGVNPNKNKIYLENVLRRKIATLPLNVQSSIIMYLLSLNKFFISFNMLNHRLDYKDITTIDMDENLFSNFDTLFYSFTSICSVDLEELPSTFCKELTIINNTNYIESTMSTTKSSAPMGEIFNANVTINNNTKTKTCVFTAGGQLLIFDETLNVLLSTSSLMYIDLFDNSVIGLFAFKNPRGLRVRSITNIDFKIEINDLVFSTDNDLIKNLINNEYFTVFSSLKSLKTKFPNNVVVAKTCVVDLSNDYVNDEYAQILINKNKKSYYDEFDLKDLKNTVNEVAKGNVYSMFFIGESGTGKSTAAKVIPYLIGMPAISINFSNNIEESDLFGTLQPNYNKKSDNDPEFIWKDGLITKAVRNGYCLILEEVNFARPGVLGKLNSLLDENRQIDLQTGEIVTAHSNFRLIATGNMGYEGTHRLNKAFVNRFEIVKVFESYSRKELEEIIQLRTSYSNKTVIAKVLDVYESILKYSKENNAEVVISVRQLINIFKTTKAFKNVNDALVNTLINSAFAEDEDLRKEFINNLLPSFRLNITF